MKRTITEIIAQELKKNRIILIIGQRQVGKTYELKRLLEDKNTFYLDFEDEAKREIFNIASVDLLESQFGDTQHSKFLLLDEIQYLNKSGSILKLIHDHFPKTQVIATGSASFLLLKNIGDSLYGRSRILSIFPLTFREIANDAHNFQFSLGQYSNINNKPKIDANLPLTMIYGSLPAVHLEKDAHEKKKILKHYTESLLFKDIFEIEGIRKPQVFKKLLILLALQIGSEVNTNELSRQLGISRNTVLEYIGLYEKFQILYTLKAYSTNPRKEVSKGMKIYFIDLGIRNAIIENFNNLENRDDTGALFENLVMNVFYFNINYFNLDYKMFFWRNYTSSEVDLVLQTESGNKLIPIEIKYTKKRLPARSFSNQYQDKIQNQFGINRENLWQFI